METTLIQLAATGKLCQVAKAADSVAELQAQRPQILEPKYDGHRIILAVTETGTRVFARSGAEKTGLLPAIEAEAARLLPAGSMIDGEAVGFNADGTQDWGAAQSALGSSSGDIAGRLTFVAFDLIAHGGIDARSLPFAQRRQVLESALEGSDEKKIRVTPQLDPTDESYDTLVGLGWEGAIAKALDAPYASGKRGYGWSKLKATHTIDAVVMGFTEGQGSFNGLVGAIVFGQYDDNGNLVERGQCSGMTIPMRREISANRAAFVGTVIELRHMGEMPTGGLRHPQYKRFRTDKPATDCVISNV